MKLSGLIILEGVLTCRTGLHIGALVESFVVGETDSPFVREPYSREHYIPGASLRGKLRALLERHIYTQQGQRSGFFRALQAGTKEVYIHSCGQLDCPVCRLFGNTPIGEAEQQIPAAIHIEDLQLERSLLELETKPENALDRVTQAANPRTLERVPKSTKFKLRMSYFIRDPTYLEEDLHNLQASLALLQDDYLGSGGSRGSGAMTLEITSAKVMRVDSQHGISAIWHSQDSGTLQKLLSNSAGLATRLQESAGVSGSPVAASAGRQTWGVRLKFRTPLHIGEPGVGVESSLTYIPSDTLFSALCHAWLAAFGKEDLEELLKKFTNDTTGWSPPFVLSSAYPYWREQFFLPKPYIPPRPYEKEPSPKTEKSPIKDLDFIPVEIFSQWIGTGLTVGAEDNLESIIKNLEENPLYREALVARARIDRVTHASDLYFCGVVSFPAEGGLYVLIEGRSDLEAKLKTCLELLGELGVGGERAAGCGKFDVRDWQKIDSIASLKMLVNGSGAEEPSAYCTLSLYHPSSKELEHIQGNPNQFLKGYAWVLRRGWATLAGPGQPQKRQACRMFKEGSVFTFKPVGTLADVGQGGATLYRSGLAFVVPVYRRDLA